MIAFKNYPSDSKRIWKNDGWYKMRVNEKWAEFSESKFNEICRGI